MVCHRRRFFQRAVVFDISGDPGCPETVVAELSFDPGRRGAPADHRIRVRPRQHLAGVLGSPASDREAGLAWAGRVKELGRWCGGLPNVVSEYQIKR
jgi:hypothetical protein